MKKPRAERILHHLIRVTLAVAFLAAGVIKLAHPERFAVTVGAFGIVPGEVLTPLSMALPCLEIAAALMLLMRLRGGLPLTAGLLLLFVSVLLYARHMGLDIDCGCYGPSDPQREAFGSIRQALWRDAAMLAGVAFLYWRRFFPDGTDGMPRRQSRSGGTSL